MSGLAFLFWWMLLMDVFFLICDFDLLYFGDFYIFLFICWVLFDLSLPIDRCSGALRSLLTDCDCCDCFFSELF